MDKMNTTQSANLTSNLEETFVETTGDQFDTNITSASEKRPRKPRRSAKEIKAEYEEFKALFEEGRPFLEITLLLGLRKSQADSYLTRISLEKLKRTQSYGVCEGHCIPESIRNILGGDRKDLFKFTTIEDEDGSAVMVRLHMSNK